MSEQTQAYDRAADELQNVAPSKKGTRRKDAKPAAKNISGTAAGGKPRTAAKKTSKRRASRLQDGKDSSIDDGLVIVDDMPLVDRERINEERKAYLEEARSQEAFD